MTPRVLIVDDEPSDCEVLAAVLGGGLRALELHFAADGASGLWIAAALAEAAGYDGAPVLVCCDLVMPDMHGLEFCARLRADPLTRALPVLAVTGLDDPAVWADLRAAGADAVTLKPVDPAAFRVRVGELLEKIL